jgi:sugar phosphate isomerase/epimerase
MKGEIAVELKCRRTIKRRQFITSGLLIGGSLSLSGLRSKSWADKVTRLKNHRFKISCAAYCYRKYLTKGEMTLDDFIEMCVDLNIDGVELTSYYFPEEITLEYLNNLKRRTFLNGLEISGTAIRNNFCLPPGQELEKEIAHVKKWINYAANFSAPCIRIFAGNIPKGATEDQAIDWCVAGIRECLDEAEKRGVFLALENHHGLVARAATVKKICDKVGLHPWFGVNLDTGNFYMDPYGDMSLIAPYAITVQVKDWIMAPGGKTKIEADLKKVFNILRQVNYRGYLVLEYEGEEDPKTAVPIWIDRLKKEALS